MTGFLTILFTYIIPLLVLLTVVVTIHELGHFLAGKAFGVAIDRFSIGFGKALWSRTDKSGVEWRIGSIPLGGYVMFSGDVNEASVPDAENLADLRQRIEDQLGPEAVTRFHAFKPIWQRAIIAAAGPFANFVLAVVAFSILLMVVGEPAASPKVGAVEPGSPAARAGFLAGDMITRVNGRQVAVFSDFQSVVSMRAGEPVQFEVKRSGKPLTLFVTPERKTVRNETTGLSMVIGRVGLASADSYQRRYNPIQAVGRGASMTLDCITTTITYLRRIITGYESGDQLSSVVGMGYATGKMISSVAHTEPHMGLRIAVIGLNLVQYLAVISVGVGFVNLLPIPVLDGGHLMFYAYEATVRKPAGPKLQAASFKVGLALVLCLMLFATWNDLHKLQAFKFIGGLFS